MQKSALPCKLFVYMEIGSCHISLFLSFFSFLYAWALFHFVQWYKGWVRVSAVPNMDEILLSGESFLLVLQTRLLQCTENKRVNENMLWPHMFIGLYEVTMLQAKLISSSQLPIFNSSILLANYVPLCF